MIRRAAVLGVLAAWPAAAAELVFEGNVPRPDLVIGGANGVLEIPVSGIAAAGPVLTHGRHSVTVVLKRGPRADLADLTGAHLGLPLSLGLCGRELARPVVRARIDSGQVSIPAASAGMAEALAEILSGAAECTRLEGTVD